MPQPVEDVSLLLAAETFLAKAELEKAGYRLPGRPLMDLPRLPRRVTDLDDDALMELFTQLTGWSAHIGGLLALHEVDERFADANYDLTWATVLTDCVASLTGRTRTESSVTVAKAEAVQHPNVRTARDHKDMVYARRKVFSIMFTNLERDSQLVSRELTRRLARHDREDRVARFRP